MINPSELHWTDLVAQARELDEGAFPFEDTPTEEAVDAVKAACETFWGHGFADDQLGSVDDFGHHYRVSRWTVETDSQGFSTVTEHGSEQEAIDWWATLEAEYAEFWEDEGE